jgi:hypothetical protein
MSLKTGLDLKLSPMPAVVMHLPSPSWTPKTSFERANQRFIKMVNRRLLVWVDQGQWWLLRVPVHQVRQLLLLFRALPLQLERQLLIQKSPPLVRLLPLSALPSRPQRQELTPSFQTLLKRLYFPTVALLMSDHPLVLLVRRANRLRTSPRKPRSQVRLPHLAV